MGLPCRCHPSPFYQHLYAFKMSNLGVPLQVKTYCSDPINLEVSFHCPAQSELLSFPSGTPLWVLQKFWPASLLKCSAFPKLHGITRDFFSPIACLQCNTKRLQEGHRSREGSLEKGQPMLGPDLMTPSAQFLLPFPRYTNTAGMNTEWLACPLWRGHRWLERLGQDCGRRTMLAAGWRRHRTCTSRLTFPSLPSSLVPPPWRTSCRKGSPRPLRSLEGQILKSGCSPVTSKVPAGERGGRLRPKL